MTPDRLAPYARLPRPYRQQTVLHSTVDAFGRAHWLLRGPAAPRDLYDAVVVTVQDGRSQETRLSSVRAEFPKLDALPDGGFVVVDSRTRTGREQVQVFDALGRPSWSFTVGDGVGQLLADESGDLWVGYFDEGVLGDELSAPCIRCWSGTGTPVWEYSPPPGAEYPMDCYALNVGRRAAWAYPYTEFPLIEARKGRPARVRSTPVRGAHGVAVHGDRVAFLGEYQDAPDRLLHGRLTETSVEPVTESRLTRPDGGTIGRRRVVCRGPRLYVQEESYPEWLVLDLAG